MRACLLASGSKGNSLYVETGDTRLLVDAGLSAAELQRRLATIGVAGSDLHGILITHEHNDHVGGAGTLARRHGIPLFVSYPTHRAAAAACRKAEVVEFESGYQFAFRDLLIDPFPITHDAVDPVGFVIESRVGRLGVATDLGTATRLVLDKLRDCRLLVVEANHDEQMLQDGPYPWHLKQRIRSRHGHLSNSESAGMVTELLHPALEGLFLAHLSEVNNDPTLVHAMAQELLASQNFCAPQLVVGDQYRPSAVLTVQ